MQGIASNPFSTMTNGNLGIHSQEQENAVQYPLAKSNFALRSPWKAQIFLCSMCSETKDNGRIQTLSFYKVLEKYTIRIDFNKDDSQSKSKLLKYFQTSTNYPFSECDDEILKDDSLKMVVQNDLHLFVSAMDFLLDANELDENCKSGVLKFKQQIEVKNPQIR
jgi:hypothetical protein